MGKYTEEILRTLGGRETAKDIVARGPRNAAREIVNQRGGRPKGSSAWSTPISERRTTGKWNVALYKRSGNEEHTGGFKSQEEAMAYAKSNLGSDGFVDFRVYPEEE